MPLPELRGTRLVFRPAGPGDLDFLAALNSDDPVMEHVAGRPLRRKETEAEWERRLGPRSSDALGLGYWIGSLGSRVVGWWGLGHTAAEPASGELGFRLLAACWHRGLGREGAQVMLHHAFGTVALDRVWAGTTTDNVASQRTLESIGLRRTHEPLPDVLTYEIRRPDWIGGVDPATDLSFRG